MKTNGIYVIKNIHNGKKYIGSSKNIENRFKIHKRYLRIGKHPNIHLQRAWDLYGEESFMFEIMEICFDENILKVEQSYFDLIDDWTQYYNISKDASGGDNIYNHPDRDSIVEKCTNVLLEYNMNLPEEERKRRSENMYGEKNINFGGKCNNNDDVKKKMSENNKKYYLTHESHRKGKTNVEIMGEEVAKIASEKLSKIASEKIGEKNPFFNKHHTNEHKERMSKYRQGKYFGKQNKQFTIDDVIYNSLGDASKVLGIHITTISWRLRSKNKKFENYKYVE